MNRNEVISTILVSIAGGLILMAFCTAILMLQYFSWSPMGSTTLRISLVGIGAQIYVATGLGLGSLLILVSLLYARKENRNIRFYASPFVAIAIITVLALFI